jgi:quinol monooxygenase YgiN
MAKYAIWAELEAKPGKEQELEDFLKSALPLAEQETGTLTWYAMKIGPASFGIFDTFADEAGRNAHLTGEIAKALFSDATKALLARDPQVNQLDLLAAKGPKA